MSSARLRPCRLGSASGRLLVIVDLFFPTVTETKAPSNKQMAWFKLLQLCIGLLLVALAFLFRKWRGQAVIIAVCCCTGLGSEGHNLAGYCSAWMDGRM
jgi:hypothetical protein